MTPTKRGVLIQPEGETVRREASDVEYHAVRVLRIGKNAPTPDGDRGLELLCDHMYLRATVTATTVMPRLTHGPQSIAPAITTSAKRGQNDLPNVSPACDSNVCESRLICASFL